MCLRVALICHPSADSGGSGGGGCEVYRQHHLVRSSVHLVILESRMLVSYLAVQFRSARREVDLRNLA